MPREYETRRLTADVQNPRFDGRCKYGPEAVRSWAAGTLFRYCPWTQRESYSDASIAAIGKVSVYGDVADILRHNSEPSAPATAKELVLDEDCTWVDAEALLQAMLDQGVVTMDQARAALQKLKED